MAEIKNSFLKSKMNKDLDDRLIPNGEYRDAQNISVGKSEEDDIGSLENVLGNTIMNATGLISPTLPNDMTVIGYLSDEYSGKLYIFSTNYTDAYPDTQPTYAPSTKRCIIYVFTPGATYADVIVDNIFLNFSTTNLIQASLIENLLFFTDNRNVPRKVNISPDGGLSGHYTNEDQLSVAKYNPYLPIKMFKKADGIVLASPSPTTTSISINSVTTSITDAAVTSATEITLTNINTDIKPDMFISGTGTVGYCKVTRVRVVGSKSVINISTSQTIGLGITLSFYPPVLIGMSVASTSSTGTVKIASYDYITVSLLHYLQPLLQYLRLVIYLHLLYLQ